MSKRTSREIRPRPCSIASALDVIGERWSLLVLREIHMGVRRFVDIHRNTGAPRDILTKRLNTLVAHGVLEKRRYCEHPERYEYHPTAAGDELRAVLALLDQWGTRWLPDAPPTPTSRSSTPADSRLSRMSPAAPAARSSVVRTLRR